MQKQNPMEEYSKLQQRICELAFEKLKIENEEKVIIVRMQVYENIENSGYEITAKPLPTDVPN